MSDKNQVGAALDGIREAVCIHTKKITDSCRDKDCIEDLRVFLTRESQAILDRSTAVRARCAELLHVSIEVEPVSYNQGYFTIDSTYFYRIVADATVGGVRPSTVCGLAIFTKRCILCGGTGSAKIFTSRICDCNQQTMMHRNCPEAVVEVVDPIILAATIEETCNCCRPEMQCGEIPSGICSCFDDELVLSGETKRLLITLGQFSIVRLERETQLLIPVFDYCIPTKQCNDTAVSSDENPCDMFSRIEFPVDEFFPASCEPLTGNTSGNQCGCGCSYRTSGS